MHSKDVGEHSSCVAGGTNYARNDHGSPSSLSTGLAARPGRGKASGRRDGRQGLVFHFDQIHCFSGRLFVLSHHRGDRLSWFLAVSLVLLILANLVAQFGINLWNRAIFDALEKRDSATVLYLSAVFFPLAAASVLFGVTNVWARMATQRRWRAWAWRSRKPSCSRS